MEVINHTGWVEIPGHKNKFSKKSHCIFKENENAKYLLKSFTDY